MSFLSPYTVFNRTAELPLPEWYDPQHDRLLQYPALLHAMIKDAERMHLDPQAVPEPKLSRQWTGLAKDSGLFDTLAALAKSAQSHEVNGEEPQFCRFQQDGLTIDWKPASTFLQMFGHRGSCVVLQQLAPDQFSPVFHSEMQLIRPGTWINTALRQAKERDLYPAPSLVIPPSPPPAYLKSNMRSRL